MFIKRVSDPAMRDEGAKVNARTEQTKGNGDIAVDEEYNHVERVYSDCDGVLWVCCE